VGEGQVDVIIGGPPCQGFSTIGRVKIASLVRNGVWSNLANPHPRFIDDPRNILYKEFMRIVRDLKPLFVVMENVPGMMSYRDGKIVKEILEDFRAIGYRAQVRVLNAADYGVPQVRRRIIFIATRVENAPIRFPGPTHGETGTKSLLEYVAKESLEDTERATLKPYVTVWDAIGDLPDPVPGRPGLADVPLPYDKPPFSDYQKFMREWGGGSPDGMLHNHITRQHNERDVKTFQILKEGQWWKDLPEEIRRLYGYRDDIFHDKIKKLARNAPSWTITAHLYKDGYMYVHPVQPRTITVREALAVRARLGTGDDIDWDSLAVWSFNRLPKYLWLCWKDELKERGITWQRFLRILRLKTADIIAWGLKDSISWEELVKRLEDAINSYSRRGGEI
jgi:DNA (cytosine-5)-methyltransferase 1